MADADVQQGITVDLVLRSDLGWSSIHAAFVTMGGMVSEPEVRAYLQGTASLPQLQRDLVSHAVNQLLDERSHRAMTQRAPYSSATVAEASGYGRSEFDGEHLAEHSRRRLRGVDPLSDAAEAERLHSLRMSGLVERPLTGALERLPRLARDYFDVMGAAITLITEDSLLTKSALGTLEGEMPREATFCNQTIRFDRTFIIPDTLEDPLFVASPYVVGAPHIRFYAGHPILGPGDLRVGALCIIDDRPRRFSKSDERKLRTLAALVQLEIWTPGVPDVPGSGSVTATKRSGSSRVDRGHPLQVSEGHERHLRGA